MISPINPCRREHGSGAPVARRRAGFTLVELLLVVVLVTIVVGVTTPYFVRSMRGHRMRTAGRTLVTVARYARSMAVLKQADIDLVLNLDTGQVDVTSSNTVLPAFTRAVEGVRMQSVQVEGADPVQEGQCLVPYRRNGLCRPFVIKLEDTHGSILEIKVDAFSSARVIDHDQ
ncbi:MAG: prepilin-type N-terminal cleavage/methylation domain-containing protein [Kiritimatiellia bacterium]|nr:prepilin-type N-terminal cleavage/methylation domain-containing protein [Lentisphaerota bacterium]